MNIGITLIVEIINFALFIYFFKKVLWRPLMGLMEARRGRIAEGLAAAERGAKALDEASAKSEEALREARNQAQEILSAANRQANQTLEQAREAAKVEGDRIVTQARAEVQREIAAAKESLRREVGKLAVQGATHILRREIDAKAHADVLAALAEEV